MVSKFRQVPLIMLANTVVKMKRDCYKRFSHVQVDFWSHRKKKDLPDHQISRCTPTFNTKSHKGEVFFLFYIKTQ